MKTLLRLMTGLWISAVILIPGFIQAQSEQLGRVYWFDWSPDGTRLAVFATNGVFIYSREFQLIQHHQHNITVPTGIWSPDGTKLLAVNQILDADTLDVLLEVDGYPRGWVSNGTQLFGIRDHEIYILDAITGMLVRTIPLDIQIEHALSSPDGTHILTSVANGIFVIDIDRGDRVTQYLQSVENIYNYVWSPDGNQVAYSATTRVPVGTPGSYAISADWAVLYTVKLIDSQTGAVLHTSEPLPAPVDSFVWSQKQPRLAGQLLDITYIWDTETLVLLDAFSIIGNSTGRIAYSPYGGILAVGVNPYTQPRAAVQQLQPDLPAASAIASFADQTIQVIVPDVSLDLLRAVLEVCGLLTPTQKKFMTETETSHLPAFIQRVESLSNDQIPPGCVADLIAVAQALQAQGEE